MADWPLLLTALCLPASPSPLPPLSLTPHPRPRCRFLYNSLEECYKFVHDDEKLGRFFEEDAKLVLRKQELIEKRDRLSKANAAMANIQVQSSRIP